MTAFRAVVFCFLPTLALASGESVTTLTELRALPGEVARKGVAVRLEGTVVGLEPSSPFHFFLYDGSNGCFIKTSPGGRPGKLSPGDRVLVEGVSDPLGYYPSVKDARVKITGSGALPTPVKPGAGQMFSPQLDSAWVDVPAVVTGYEVGDDRITLATEVYGLPFKAELPLTPSAEDEAAALLQRPARLRGIMGTIFNGQRQMTDRHFFVSSFESITPTVPQANGESRPLLKVSQLLTAGFGPTTPVRLQGIVTQRNPKGFYLRDDTDSTMVQAAKGERYPPGAMVEAEGFGAVAPFRPILRATRVKDFGPSSPVKPLPFDFKTADLSLVHAEWVTLDADFLGQREGPIDGILQFRSAGEFFEALHPNKAHDGHRPLTVGDKVRLTGICELTTTHALPRLDWVDGFRIHLPETGGMEILHRAPWWSTQRLLIALGLMSGVAALGFLGAWTLRRQVKRQLAVIGDKLRAEAVGEERDRMARELHDTLEQQLSGVALQLDSLDHAVKHNSSAAASVLTLARRMLRYTRLEARRSVWDLRSKVLENDGLSSALRAISETGVGSSGPAIQVLVSGDERTHPAGVDFHLLRIAQEAVTNAIKHGETRSITISLDYLADQTRLTIRDEGRGFDSSSPDLSPGPHFGLLGMRERAAKIGAELTLTSLPGQGCEVTVLLPDDFSSKPT
jgi:signal transduction histidine kinase